MFVYVYLYISYYAILIFFIDIGAYEGDIILDPDEKEETFGQVTYASIKGGRWPNGIIPYESGIGM